MQATHVYMYHLEIYQSHRLSRQCIVEIEITIIKATGYHAVSKGEPISPCRKSWLLVWSNQVPGGRDYTS